MRSTPPGVLRVVARRWHKDTTYAVWIRAYYQGYYDSLMIAVVPPDSLGSTSRYITDVLNTRVDLDSVLVSLGGSSGIPPQVLKAMIFKESSFLPQMRYEPYRDAELQQMGDPFYVNSSYLVGPTTNGDPPPPTNHRFRRWGQWSTSYLPAYQGSIFQVCSTYSAAYPHSLYRSVHTSWHENVYSPIWDSIATVNPNADSLAVAALALPIADSRWPTYLKTRFRGGLARLIAQTRVLSSYGFMQMMYYDATVDRGYPRNESSLPEYLMLLDTTLNYGVRHLMAKFASPVVQEDPQASQSWREGFEGTLERALRAYNGWSHSNPYGKAILGLTGSYRPRKR
jgi:hypothetical protein